MTGSEIIHVTMFTISLTFSIILPITDATSQSEFLQV